MKRVAAAALALALGTTGCANLVVLPSDSPGTRRTKEWTQVALTLATVSIFPKVQRELEHETRMNVLREGTIEAAARFRRLWIHRILGARTWLEMTRAFGRPPLACHPGEGETEICTWTTKTLLIRAAESPVVPTGRLDLPLRPDTVDQIVIAACALPLDGSARPAKSCDVSFW